MLEQRSNRTLLITIACVFVFFGILSGVFKLTGVYDRFPLEVGSQKDGELTSRIYKDKLIPEKILEVVGDDRDDTVMIMAGVDDNHLVCVSINRDRVEQGLQTEVLNDFSAFNGHDVMYIHNAKQFGTQIHFTINTLTRKNKTAMVTISGRLVSTTPDRNYLDIVPVTLILKGKEFDRLVGKHKV